MHARLTGRAALAAALVFTSGLYAVAVAAPQALAATGADNCNSASSGGTSGGGSVVGGTVTMWLQLEQSSQSMLCSAGSSSASGDPNWQPPQCWWGPQFSPDELAGAIGSLNTNGGSAIETYTALDGVYASLGPDVPVTGTYVSTSGPNWDDYNINASPPGEWWGLVWSDNITLAGIDSCTNIENNHFPVDWYWVADQAAGPDPGDAPVLDPQELALYIEGKVKLYSAQVQTSPALDHATVGLSNWLWADGAGNTTIPKTDICTQPQYGHVCVTLSAQATKLTIAAPGAQIFSACTLHPGTTEIGTPYTGGNGNPPCGLTFTQAGTSQVTIGTYWKVKINWGGGEIDLNPPPLYQTLPADVQAIQAVNGGSPAANG
jgi:hypothetical protein